MQVTVEELSPVERRVEIVVPWERVKEKLDEAYRDLARGVTLKGFRKGKVPRPMLEKLYGKRVERDVATALVKETFMRAAKEHELVPVAEPVVDDAGVQAGQSFRYSARVEVLAKIEPKDYVGLSVGRRAASVTDDDFAHALEHKRMEYTQYKPVEGRSTADRGHVLHLILDGTIGEHKVTRREVQLDLGHADHEPLPGLTAAVLGLALDAKDHPLELAIPADAPQRELAGQTARLRVTVKEAREKIEPALDDEFAKDTGEAETLAELKDKLRAKLVDQEEKVVDREVRSALVQQLLERNPFPVAPALVERHLDSLVERAKLSLYMRGIDPRTANVDERRMRDELREEAADEMRAMFLLDAIATKEGVEVSDADLEKELVDRAAQRNQNLARLRAEYQKEGRMDALRQSIREAKTLDLLLSKATVTSIPGGAAVE